jgi:hypothetical protein
MGFEFIYQPQNGYIKIIINLGFSQNEFIFQFHPACLGIQKLLMPNLRLANQNYSKVSLLAILKSNFLGLTNVIF